MINKVLNALRKDFEIVSGDLDTFAGMQIVKQDNKFFIHQENYVNKILEKYGMSECKSVDTPSIPKLVLSPREKDEVEINVPYRGIIGSLMFLASVSRPDIAYIVSYLGRFLNSYSKEHYVAAKHVLRYLSGTKNMGILFQKSAKLTLTGYSDADFANDVVARRSVTGYVFFLSQGPVSWSSFKQSTPALSTTEAEYMAASAASREAIWLSRLLRDTVRQGVIPRILIDNRSALRITKNPEFHKRTKHIDVQYHYIRHKYESGEIDVDYVKSQDQLADLLTKGLAKEKLYPLRDKICVQRNSC